MTRLSHFNRRQRPSRSSLPRRVSRQVVTAVACVAIVALSACSALAPREDEAMSASPPFAPGWQEHTRPLFNLGPGPTAGTTIWLVSGLTPRGTYQVISREGDRARLLKGHRFEVDSSVNREIRLILPFTSGSLEALDEHYVLSQAPAPKKAAP
jgi:hypothetical protein